VKGARLDARLHLADHASSRVQAGLRVLLQRDLARELRETLVVVPCRVVGDQVPAERAESLAVAPRRFAQIELDLCQAPFHCVERDDARHRVVGDVVRPLRNDRETRVRVERQPHEASDREDESKDEDPELARSGDRGVRRRTKRLHEIDRQVN
jgi:hypothetical protein